MLDQAAALAEYIHATLMAVVYLVATYGRIRVRRDPHTGEIVGVDLVVDELPETVLVNVNTARLSVVYLAMDNGWICASLHLEARYSIVVNVVRFEVAEPVVEREYTDVTPVMNVIPPHDRVRIVLHPYARQGVPRDLIVLVRALRVIGNVQTNVFTIRYVTVLHQWIGTDARNAHRCAH